jgi:hypothetical protein
VTEAIVEEVKAWQSWPLEEVYPIVYLDAMMVKMRDNGQVQNQAIYVVLGVDLSGQKEVPLRKTQRGKQRNNTGLRNSQPFESAAHIRGFCRSHHCRHTSAPETC